ncbi:MAG: hypothetical protein L0K86_27615, partial [Actinomycetia bacterium]|nr:hypothetical protein [Actinomycetes bacterium]
MRVPDVREARRARRSLVTIAGVAGQVGCSTVATGLGAEDRGVFVGRPVDVLVCRAGGDSLVRAGYAAQLVTAWSGQRPVVAVTAADAAGPSRPVAARLGLLEPHTAGVVVLPFVRRWRELAAPGEEIGDLLRLPARDLPRVLRRYAGALGEVRDALEVRSLVVARPVPVRAPATAPATTPAAAVVAAAVRSVAGRARSGRTEAPVTTAQGRPESSRLRCTASQVLRYVGSSLRERRR